MKAAFLGIGMAVIALSASNATAATLPQLSNLSLPQSDVVLRALGAHLAFRPLEPASAYGSYWGFSFGVIGELTSLDELKGVFPGTNTAYIPGGMLYAGVQGPLGLAIETGFVTKVRAGGAEFKTFGANLKWTVTKAFLDKSPVSVAIRGMHTAPRFEYKQSVTGGSVDVTYTSKIWGANLSVGVPLPFVEPYAGIGLIEQSSTLSGAGTVSLFDQTFTSANSIENQNSSSWLFAGAELRLAVATFTVEYDRIFGVNSFAAKLGLKF